MPERPEHIVVQRVSRADDHDAARRAGGTQVPHKWDKGVAGRIGVHEDHPGLERGRHRYGLGRLLHLPNDHPVGPLLHRHAEVGPVGVL